jgi:hypothetical protein
VSLDVSDRVVCGVLGLLLHDPMTTQTSLAGQEMYVDWHSS